MDISLKELDKVVFQDVGNKIKDSGKWPLVIDPSQRAGTFLKYKDVNYIEAISPAQMAKEKIRMALLGALSYGPLVQPSDGDDYNLLKFGLVDKFGFIFLSQKPDPTQALLDVTFPVKILE